MTQKPRGIVLLGMGDDSTRGFTPAPPLLENNMQFIERKILELITVRANDLDLHMRVYNGEEWLTEETQSHNDILAKADTTDECRIYIFDQLTSRSSSEYVGWIYLTFGEGETMITDYTVGLEEFMKPINKEIDF